ncbi:transposase [Paraglaciecola psychrophila 170]|nr:transposase [Paraglaciecola psychrophila 170]
MCAYFTSLKGKPSGHEFIDSTSIKVCHNIEYLDIKPSTVSLNEVKVLWVGFMVLSST